MRYLQTSEAKRSIRDWFRSDPVDANKKEEFLNEWKQICEEIKDGLYDLQDFCDSSKIYEINNELICEFGIKTGWNRNGRSGFNAHLINYDNIIEIFRILKNINGTHY